MRHEEWAVTVNCRIYDPQPIIDAARNIMIHSGESEEYAKEIVPDLRAALIMLIDPSGLERDVDDFDPCDLNIQDTTAECVGVYGR